MTVIWPVYMDKNKTCSQGRKIPLSDSVSDPNLEEVSNAAKKLNLNPIKQADKSYPGEWYKHSGRVLVESETLSKKEMISLISKDIKLQREEKAKEIKIKNKNKKKKKKRYRK